jgi:hypothetical protein
MSLGQDIMTRNRNSSQAEKHKDSPPPKKFPKKPSSGKAMLILSFDSKGIILAALATSKENCEWCLLCT